MAVSEVDPPSEADCLRSLHLRSTASLRSFLQRALESAALSGEEQRVIKAYTETQDGDPIRYQLLRICSTRLRERGEGEAVWLHESVTGSDAVLLKPKAPEKSEELKARLAQLQEEVDRKEYAELVKDVTRGDRRQKDRVFIGSYREQLGFGLHVAAIMFTGFVFGYTVFRSQFPDQPVLHAAGGTVGLIIGMFVEVILFMIRAARVDDENEKASKRRREVQAGRRGPAVAGSSASTSPPIDSGIQVQPSKRKFL